MPPRVTATDAAIALIRTLKDIHGPVMFHQSGGCCDGSAPMCFALGDFKTGAQDVLLGEIEESPFYIGAAQFEYWRHTQLIIDVVDGRGGMFSLEGPEGKRFLTRSRVFSDDEWAKLKDTEQTKT
ncbi:acetaldehyde dehydrogenase [Thalassospira sp. MCCC 1A01428]|nr:acetaldehyde dehydrogenase [Thalassospira sp. MCCC 1A01428]